MSEKPVEQAAPAAVPETQPAEKTEEPTTNGNTATEETSNEKSAETTTDKPAETTSSEPAAPEAAPAPAKDEPAEAKKDEGAESKPAELAADKPEFLSKNPALSKFFDRLPDILAKTGHTEMWGVPLKDANDPPTANIMIKFLRANEGNVKLAEEQLTKALEWRRNMDPISLAENARFSATKFGGLGYLTTYNDTKTGKKVVFTWNIYGAVKKVDSTFGDIEEFIRWRAALMEMGVKELKLNEATSVIDYEGEDPYQMMQVHDYQNLSFFRMNPTIRSATKKTIDVFSTAYPEVLREKFFVNVPTVMGWVFTAIKPFLSKNTIRKFHPITNGANLAREFPGFADEIPSTYGGKAAPLKESGRTVALDDDDAPAAAAPAEEPKAKEESAKDATKEEPAKEPAKEEPTKEEPAKEEPAKEEPAKEEKPVAEVTATEAAPAAAESK